MLILLITNTWRCLMVVPEQRWTRGIQENFTRSGAIYIHFWKSALASDAILFNTSVPIRHYSMTPCLIFCGLCCHSNLNTARPTDARLRGDVDNVDAELEPLTCFVPFKHSCECALCFSRPHPQFLIQRCSCADALTQSPCHPIRPSLNSIK